MQKKTILSFLLVVLLLSCASVKSKPFTKGTFETFTFNSKSLEENLINEQVKQTVKVYLPGSYTESNKEYPVIYYLAGFGGSANEVFNAAGSNTSSEHNAIDSAILNGSITECIIVGISGTNNLGGSFYVNSPVIGNWEDHILEIVSEIDSRYRTLKTPESRGISGFSMGGFGSVNLGLRNPDVFGYIYAFSPGLFSENGFDAEVWKTWKQWNSVLYSYGAAFTPDITLESIPYSKIPSTTLTAEEAIEGWGESWSIGYGDPLGKIDFYKEKDTPILGIKIDYAENDYFTWLIDGSKYFYSKLMEAGVEVEQEEVPGQTHNIDSVIVEEYMLKYFGSVFQ